jgi:large subunit ribosomal protein L24
MNIKKGDTVVVIAGKDKGKTGKVVQAFPKKERVIVEGVNMVTKHQKATQQMQQAGIIHQEAAIHVSNVMIYDAKAKAGTRIKHDVDKNGKKVRVSVKSGTAID